jgi:hypothetical protein
MNGAAAAAFSGLMAATLFACSSDDNATQPPGPDSGNDSASTTSDAAHDSATTDAPSADAQGDGTTVDSGHADASDSSVEADTSVPLPPLDICLTLDTDAQYSISVVQNGGTAPATLPGSPDDRAGSWVMSMAINQNTGGGYVANVLQNDCRINGIVTLFQGPDAAANNLAFSNFSNQIQAVFLEFTGCGPADAGVGPVTFADLVPPSASSHVFTTADLAVIADIFTNSMIEGATYEWFLSYTINTTPPLPEPLTSDQIDAIKAHVAALAPMANVLNSSHLTYSTCGADAGTDAGADSSSDAAHD